MDARVALSVAFSFLVLLVSLSEGESARFRRRADPPWARANGFGPPGRGRNKFSDQTYTGRRGPPGGVPPGLSGGGPPGLGGNLPPGWSKPGKGKPNLDGDYNKPERTTTERRTPDQEETTETSSYRPTEESKPKKCRKNEFRCGSSECLPETVRCDNKFDCRDSSDEHGCIAERGNEAGCVLPEQPKGGSYVLGGCAKPCVKQPGDKVPGNSLLTYTCRDNYILNGSTVSFCVNDVWHNQPTCIRPCYGLNSSSVDISCSYKGNNVSCMDQIKPGTVATLSCKSSYKLPVTNDPGYRTVTCGEDGLWDRPVFRCLSECGIPISKGNTLIVNGFEAKLGVFPWHVGIYNKKSETEYEQICGGTLISNNLVVSAAHCFYDEGKDSGQLIDESQYAVAAGKHFRAWNAAENYVQKSSVADISLPQRYQGASGNFAEDIALIKLDSPFELTSLVRPVCVDWEDEYGRLQLQVGHNGKAVGWGKTITGNPSETLQEVTMPFVPFDQCRSAVPLAFRGFITSDKFCAGRLNGSSLCEGDSGGGLCFEMNGIWYLRGVVSVSPVKENKCDYHSYTVFTSTSFFREWVRAAFVTS